MINLNTDLNLNKLQVEKMLEAWQGRPTACTGLQRLTGGMVNSVFRLEFDRPPFSAVIKLNTEPGSFSSESRALETLHAHTHFPSPQVYLHDSSARLLPYAFLLIETIPGRNLSGINLPAEEYALIERRLAEVLVELHSHTRPCYGEIGDEQGCPRWSDIFISRLVEMRGKFEVIDRLPLSVLKDIDHTILIAETALQDQGPPTLVHGDLWEGNFMVVIQDGHWRLSGIIDPSLQYADVEFELAYLECFGTRREAFFEAYTASCPLRPGYTARRLFYWLHTALIHVWLFGDAHYREFSAQTAAAIRRTW